MKFMNVKDTSTETGLSQYYLRQRIKEGTIPIIRSGTSILIDVSAFLEQLHAEAKGNVKGANAD